MPLKRRHRFRHRYHAGTPAVASDGYARERYRIFRGEQYSVSADTNSVSVVTDYMTASELSKAAKDFADAFGFVFANSIKIAD